MRARSLNVPRISRKLIMQTVNQLCPEHIVFLDRPYKTEVLSALVDKAIEQGCVPDGPAFRAAVEEREAVLSTGIGQGIAIPHAKLDGIESFFVIVGILNPQVDWDALDDQPVGLVFLIGGPDNAQNLYLQILSKLMGKVKNEEVRTAMLEAKTPADVVAILT